MILIASLRLTLNFILNPSLHHSSMLQAFSFYFDFMSIFLLQNSILQSMRIKLCKDILISIISSSSVFLILPKLQLHQKVFKQLLQREYVQNRDRAKNNLSFSRKTTYINI